MSAVALTVDGRPSQLMSTRAHYARGASARQLVVPGTHAGCDTSQCGACGAPEICKAVKACTLFLWQIEGADVLTIEGVADPNGPLHPMQEAFREHHGLQCGYCTPGMIMTALEVWWYRKGHDLDDLHHRLRTRRQSVPLHRVPEHREGDSRGSENPPLENYQKPAA